ncbi:YheU family protein [bacterium CPR1]|nr:YheU family protein [bacterium CPR1]
MEIPFRQLSSEALQGLLEEIASRDGTELTPVADKVATMRAALEAGRLRLVFDPTSETCSLIETQI